MTEEGTSGDSNLDAAWRLLTLRSQDREELEFDEYFKREYDVDMEAFIEFFNHAWSSDEPTEENVFAMFEVGFEFGKIHEKYVKDMQFLGG